MECCVLLDRVILESVPVFKLLASEDQTLLIMRNTFSVLDLGLDVFDLVCWFDVECDVLACECLYEELHKEKWRYKNCSHLLTFWHFFVRLSKNCEEDLTKIVKMWANFEKCSHFDIRLFSYVFLMNSNKTSLPLSERSVTFQHVTLYHV